jgi:hypothetical protein
MANHHKLNCSSKNNLADGDCRIKRRATILRNSKLNPGVYRSHRKSVINITQILENNYHRLYRTKKRKHHHVIFPRIVLQATEGGKHQSRSRTHYLMTEPRIGTLTIKDNCGMNNFLQVEIRNHSQPNTNHLYSKFLRMLVDFRRNSNLLDLIICRGSIPPKLMGHIIQTRLQGKHNMIRNMAGRTPMEEAILLSNNLTRNQLLLGS